MEEKTIDQHIESINKKFEDFTKLMDGSAKKEDFDNLTLELGEIKDQLTGKEDAEGVIKRLETLTGAVETQGLALTAIKDAAPKEVKTLEDHLTEHKDAFKEVSSGKIVSFTIDKTDVTRASVTDHTLAMRLTDVGQIATRRNVIRSLFRTATVGPNSNGVIRYVDQLAITRNADWKAESYQKPESAITWVEKSIEIEKIADTIPVTMEALADVDFISGEIRNLLLTNLELQIDADLFNGSGATPIIEGVYTYADVYVPAAAGIANATIYDLLVKVHEDIAGTTKYMPNYAVMNIADINEMRLSKDANGNYILPPFTSQNGDQVAGMTIIASGAVTANTMLVGDFDYATLYTLGGLKIDIGLIDKQFIENMVTLRAEERMGLLVRSVHEDAFRQITDIDAAVVTIGS
jgi:HK97 family phage major capsid protein